MGILHAFANISAFIFHGTACGVVRQARAGEIRQT